MKKKKLSIDEIDAEIYGDGGLLDRVKDKICSLGVPFVATRTGKSVQNIYGFIRADEPKMKTIKDYAEVLGVE
jgi:hypothetical protein